MSALLVLIFVLVSPSSLAALDCDRFNSDVEGTYWDEILQCPSCLATEGCGYCLSSLRCEAGNDEGPSSGLCSNWIFGGDTTDFSSGGDVLLTTGYSSKTSSGFFSLRTVQSGESGVSGSVDLYTGTSSAGSTSSTINGSDVNATAGGVT